MAKISFYEMASVLVEHNGLDAEAANEFVRTMFDIIQEKLTIDEQIKIKGLGTFKIVKVDARESINVNTGERILIDEHQKISFVPDTAMKELINKPFSQFETVILNEGVSFEDIDKTEPVSMPTQEAQEEKEITETKVVLTPESQTPETHEPQTPETHESQTPETQYENTPIPKKEKVLYDYPDDEDEDSSHIKTLIITLATILIVGIAVGGGYFFGSYMSSSKHNSHKIATTEPTMTEKEDVTSVPTSNSDSTVQHNANTEMHEQKETVETEQKIIDEAKPEEPTKAKEEPANDDTKNAFDSNKYAQMDARVRTGAYIIIGEDFTITARANETTARLAKRVLGEGMECYIEVFNDITPNTKLKEGQKIKVPKLKLKKKK